MHPVKQYHVNIAKRYFLKSCTVIKTSTNNSKHPQVRSFLNIKFYMLLRYKKSMHYGNDISIQLYNWIHLQWNLMLGVYRKREFGSVHITAVQPLPYTKLKLFWNTAHHIKTCYMTDYSFIKICSFYLKLFWFGFY